MRGTCNLELNSLQLPTFTFNFFVQAVKDTLRATVHVTFDGRVIKEFRGPKAQERFENEVKLLLYLEKKECLFVPRLLESDPTLLKIITTSCGSRVEHLDEKRCEELFAELEEYGVRHDDPNKRNVTYRQKDGRFCLIDFEFATILEEEKNRSLSWSGTTDRGPIRANNEDTFLGLSIDEHEVHYLGKEGTTCEKKDYVFAVCDGIGGAMAGEFASRIAVEKITKMFPAFLAKIKKGAVLELRDSGAEPFRESSKTNELAPSPTIYRTDPFEEEEEEPLCYQLLVQLFHEIHRALLFVGSSYEECRGMGTTLTLAWIRASKLYFAHIGDSRLYHLPAAGGIHQLSEDDTHVGWLFRQGTLNERESKNHPRRHLLQKALGAEHQFVTPQTGSLPYSTGDRFLLCTDGVSDTLFDAQLLDLLTSPATHSSSKHLVKQALLQAGKDNATAVVLSFGELK